MAPGHSHLLHQPKPIHFLATARSCLAFGVGPSPILPSKYSRLNLLSLKLVGEKHWDNSLQTYGG